MSPRAAEGVARTRNCARRLGVELWPASLGEFVAVGVSDQGGAVPLPIVRGLERALEPGTPCPLLEAGVGGRRLDPLILGTGGLETAGRTLPRRLVSRRGLGGGCYAPVRVDGDGVLDPAPGIARRPENEGGGDCDDQPHRKASLPPIGGRREELVRRRRVRRRICSSCGKHFSKKVFTTTRAVSSLLPRGVRVGTCFGICVGLLIESLRLYPVVRV